MTGAERGYLMLCCDLGDERVRPLTSGEVEALRAALVRRDLPPETELTESVLQQLGVSRPMSGRIIGLLDRERWLDSYLAAAERSGVTVLTCLSPHYPAQLKNRLGGSAPPVLFCRGDAALLTRPCVSLVGSRDLSPMGEAFARRVGALAAKEGLALCSGGARGADRTAQNACRNLGGSVLCIVSDSLLDHDAQERILYVSLDGYRCSFSAARAHARNRIIHALGQAAFVAQCRMGVGGTWSGTAENLRLGLSPVYCQADGSEAAAALEERGAHLVEYDQLLSLRKLLG
ncbi:MAG: DNA-processing protein DprA [Oscillospiraceae bacterium]|nr:DNA-processing protein DprA [Oscillospiraceae bacterium]